MLVTVHFWHSLTQQLVLPQSKVQSALKSAISDFKKALNLKSL